MHSIHFHFTITPKNYDNKNSAVRCTKAFAMHRVRGSIGPEWSVVRNFTLHFCKGWFPRLECVASGSIDNNFTGYSRTVSRNYYYKKGGGGDHTLREDGDGDGVVVGAMGIGVEKKVRCEVEVVSWRERKIKAEIFVNADVDSVWNALTDYERLADFVPNLVSRYNSNQ